MEIDEITNVMGMIVEHLLVACTKSNDIGPTELLDVFYKFAMILIAFFNILFAYMVYKLKDKKESNFKEADRKIALLKTLILDYNLKFVYQFFDDLADHLKKLDRNKDANKREIERLIQSDFKGLNEKFVNLLAAVDSDLHSVILSVSDKYRDKILGNIGDEGINLYVDRQYADLIKKPYEETKREILKTLFNYKGE